ncbi:ABC transporter permease [Jiangella anatolica]|uniref:ABC transporter permease n=1 Tax=Jiangella anatolica TaxID=2670374 RepID=A0A2W2C1L2_9ACTN|nr:ABC transporter permease [Jiangella anatolica]PZF86644.1 ABC transporter permease [Jiangella anatolica]
MSTGLQTRPARQSSALVVLALAFACLVAGLCVVSFVGLGLDPQTQRLLEARQPPTPGHWLGTDLVGRDVLARVVHGASVTVIGPAAVALGAVAIAVPLALVAAERGGVVDAVVMRTSDTLLALPSILVIIVIAGLFGGGYWLAAAVLVFLIVPSGLRIARSVALGQKNLPYQEAARLIGASTPRRMFVHTLPNLLPTIVATLLLDFVAALVALSSLSFLGLGAPPGSTDWGTMLAENLRLIEQNPWACLAPAVMLVLTAYSATTIGDWLHLRLEGRRG